MRKLKKLASLVMALTLSLGLCTVAPALAAEEALNKPTTYMSIDWTWTVGDSFGGNVNPPEIRVSYTDKWGKPGSFNLMQACGVTAPKQLGILSQKGVQNYDSTLDHVYVSGMPMTVTINFPTDVVKINSIAVIAKNNAPTFKANNIRIKFAYYYPAVEDASYFGETLDTADFSQYVCFRTETYTSASGITIKSKDKNSPVYLPNFKTVVNDLAGYPGGLPNNLTGSVFGEGSPMLLIVGGAVLVAAFHVVLISNRIKKEKARVAG